MSELTPLQLNGLRKGHLRLLLQLMMSLTQSPALTEQEENNQQRELLKTWTI
jgi:hypothetical protein